MEEFDVFLSHHSGDKPWVIALKAALVVRGVKVWLDQDEIRPGDLFIDALERGVEASRCVALVVSPRSLKSRWVKEEYSRALQLSNSRERDVRIIPCLLEGAAVPGFLANRLYVDFRDPSRFEQGVHQLFRGIRGDETDDDRTEGGETGGRHGEDRTAPPILTGGEFNPLELKYLDRWIDAVRKERSMLLLVRACAPLLGLIVGSQTPGGIDALPLGFVGSATVTGLLGFGVTARPWSTRTLELKQLAAHRDAMELCSQDFRPVCPDVIEAFNRLLKRRIGIGPDRTEVSA